MLWLGPAAFAGAYTDWKRLWTWGLALGAGLLMASTLWIPQWIGDQQLLTDDAGRLWITAANLAPVWRRAADLLLLAAALEGAVLLLWGSGAWIVPGLVLCAASLSASILGYAPWVLLASAGAVSVGYACLSLNSIGEADRFVSLRLYLASLLAVASLALALLMVAGSVGFRPAWLGRLEIPLLDLGGAGGFATLAAAPALRAFPPGHVFALLGLLIVVSMGAHSAFWTSGQPESAKRKLAAFSGCLIWALLAGDGFGEPLLWWAAGCLGAGTRDAWPQEFVEDQGEQPEHAWPVGAMLLAGNASVWIVGALVLLPSWLPEYRTWRLEPGPLQGLEAAAALRRAVPTSPEADYLLLRAAVSDETGLPVDEDISLETLKPLAEGASRSASLAPWAWMAVANAAFASGDGDEYLLAAREVIRADEAPSSLLERCADRLRYIGAHDDALLALEKAVEADPYSAALRVKLARRYQVARLDDEASQQFRAARVLDPARARLP